MFSFTNNETVTWRGRGADVKNKIQGAGPCFGWIASASSSHCLNVCEAEHIYVYSFAWTNVSSVKNTCFAIRARVDTKFLNLSHHVLSMDDWPGDANLFPCGANLWRSSANIQPKQGPAPWILFLTSAPRPLQVTVSLLVKLNISMCPFFWDKYIFSKKHMFCNLGARWHNFFWICSWCLTFANSTL